MSFWDNVKRFAQPYSDEDYDDYDDEAEGYDEEPQETGRSGRRPSPFASSEQDAEPAAPAASNTVFGGSIPNMSSGKQEVVLFHAKSIEDAAKAADELRKKRAVILNMENVDKAVSRRIVDFLSGSIYALNGSLKKVAQSTYLFCPQSMDVIGDLESVQTETESFF